MSVTPQVTLNAALQNLGGAGSANSILRVMLCGFGTAVPTVMGTALLVQVTQDFTFTSGTLSALLWGNDVISPSGTFYCISLIDPDGNTTAVQNYQLVGTGVIDLSLLTPYDPTSGTANSGTIYTLFARGLTATVGVGTVITLPAGSPASIVNVGTATDGILNFSIPRGATGLTGAAGPPATFRGAWSSTTLYANGDAVSFTNGSSYVSLQDGNINENPSTQAAFWGIQAAAGPPTTFTGPWSDATTYAIGQAVSFTDGGSYVSLQNANINYTPETSPTWWGVLSIAGTVPANLTPTSVTITPFTLAALPPNAYGAVLAIIDGSGNVAAMVLSNGNFVVPTLSIGQTNPLLMHAIPSNPKGAVFAIGDPNGSMALMVLADGSTTMSKLTVVKGASFAEIDYGSAVVTPLVPNTAGLVGPVVADGAGNVAFGVRASDGKIVGTLANPNFPIIPPIGKATNLKAGTLKPMFALNLEMVLGESTGSGINSVPIISTVQPWQNLMFSNGVRNGSITSYTLSIPPLTGLGSFVPLIQFEEFGTGQIAGEIFGETSCNGICDRMASDLLTIGVKATFLGTTSALPGAPYGAIAPGTTMYEQMLQLVQAAFTHGSTLYASVGVLTTMMVFGINDDQNAGNPNFGTEMVGYQAQCESDIKAITGQTGTIPMVIMQPGRWGFVSPGRAVNGLVTPVVAPQQLAICMATPSKFLFSTPTYFLAPSSDGVHFTGPSEQWLGEYYAETKLNYQLGLPSTALIPGTPLLFNKTIVIPFNVQNGPLVFDTVQVLDTATTITGSMKGFEVWDSTGAVVPILSAAIGPDNASVVLQLGSSPVGGAVGYGWSALAGAHGGPQTGPRGNVRDSNPAPSFYGHPNMYHWAPHFKFNLA